MYTCMCLLLLHLQKVVLYDSSSTYRDMEVLVPGTNLWEANRQCSSDPHIVYRYHSHVDGLYCHWTRSEGTMTIALNFYF